MQAYKRRFSCYGCNKLCEVSIPDNSHVRYLIKCPACGKLNKNEPELRAEKPPDCQVQKPPPVLPDKKQVAIKQSPGSSGRSANRKHAKKAAKRTGQGSKRSGARKTSLSSSSSRKKESNDQKRGQNKRKSCSYRAGEDLEAEAIFKKRKNNAGDTEYLVKWAGRDESQNSWESASNLVGTGLIKAFESQRYETNGSLAGREEASSSKMRAQCDATTSAKKTIASPGEAGPSLASRAARGRISTNGKGDGHDGRSRPKTNGRLFPQANIKSTKGSGSTSKGVIPNVEDDMDGLLIEESDARIAARPVRDRPTSKSKVAIIARLGGIPPEPRVLERMASSSMPTCEEAFVAAEVKPRWQVGDDVEVAWKGKGFEGSWASATVVMLEGKHHVLVRFREFVDTDGSPLVETMGVERLRLPPPPTDKNWIPVIGEQIEGLWNDAWWEGTVKEFHYLKGVLFQYDRYANWLWLPLRCLRPRPPLQTFYPQRSPPDGEEVDADSDEGIPSGVCGLQGCRLPNNHLGLCQVLIEGSRRAKLKETTEMQRQAQLWNEIKSDRRITQQMAVARAESLKKTEEAGVSIKASKGNRAQWHANFKLDEFDQPFFFARDLCVLQEDLETGERDLRGLLVIGEGYTLADTYHMLMTEHQLCPRNHWHLVCLGPTGETIVDLLEKDPMSNMMELLPEGACDLLVKNCPPPPGVLSGVIQRRTVPNPQQP